MRAERRPGGRRATRARWAPALALGGVAALLATCGSGASPLPPRPVLLISIDTLRADRLGLYGHERDTSPFLDRLGARGLVFEEAYTPCPWTLVAHMTMLTGLYPPQHGVERANHALADETPLLAERLRAAGYQTVGLYHPVWVTERHGFGRGFDRFRPHVDAEEAGAHLDEELERLDPSRPWFVFLHLFGVHRGPYRPGEHSIYPAPAPYQELFAPGATALLPLVAERLDPTDAVQREALGALYDGGIRYLDACLERWFDELERRGLLAHALVIVTADHGENLLERGRIEGHGRFYQEGIHVPLIVHLPKDARAGTRVAERASLCDVVPTVLDFAGLPADPRLPGFSLLGPLPPERALMGSMDAHSYVLRGPRKLAQARAERVLAYDLARDPREEHGRILASAPEFQAWTTEALATGLDFPPPRSLAPLSAEEAADLRALGYGGQIEDE